MTDFVIWVLWAASGIVPAMYAAFYDYKHGCNVIIASLANIASGLALGPILGLVVLVVFWDDIRDIVVFKSPHSRG